MKKYLTCIAFVIIVIVSLLMTMGCSASQFSTDFPDLTSEGWRNTLHSDFTQMDSLEGTVWAPAPHGLRKQEYWCADMLEFSGEGLVVKSERTDDHVCSSGICPSDGIFTGGIVTRDTIDGESVMLFEQAYGYYEATVKVPRGKGMWSAFWIMSDKIGKVGNGGKDGAEIDIYESSFYSTNHKKTGHAVHYDAYSSPYYKLYDHVENVGYDLYDGEFHTYSLLWTPDRYVFFVDGIKTGETDFGVSTVPEYLKVTVEIRDPDHTVYGPYGQKIGTFENGPDTDFVIKEINVYQNDAFEPYIKSHSDYQDQKEQYKIRYTVGGAVGGVAGLALVTAAIVLIVKHSKKKKNA